MSAVPGDGKADTPGQGAKRAPGAPRAADRSASYGRGWLHSGRSAREQSAAPTEASKEAEDKEQDQDIEHGHDNPP